MDLVYVNGILIPSSIVEVYPAFQRLEEDKKDVTSVDMNDEDEKQEN